MTTLVTCENRCVVFHGPDHNADIWLSLENEDVVRLNLQNAEDLAKDLQYLIGCMKQKVNAIREERIAEQRKFKALGLSSTGKMRGGECPTCHNKNPQLEKYCDKCGSLLQYK